MMKLVPFRNLLMILCLAFTLVASAIYDTLVVQDKPGVQLLLALGIAGCLASLVALNRFPVPLLHGAFLAAWPLHLFTLSFVAICVAAHGGSQMRQVVQYTVFGYATYLLLPIVFLSDHRLWVLFVKGIAVFSAILAVPSFAGAVGMSSFLGFPLRLKHSYANFSGIIASAGLFEHAEGHAFQMAIGMLCAWYALRRGGHWILYAGCLLFSTLGLIISQGRAAILGIGIIVMLGLLPPLFRRSQLLFVGTLAVTLCFPFLVLSQIKQIPVVGSYLRVERGLSGREEAWRFAITAIAERPWSGHGFMASTQLTEEEQKTLRKSGFSGAGTTFHNTYISKAVDLGLIVTGIYTLLYLVPLMRICASRYAHDQMLIQNMLILALTASIFRDYNIGGVRSTTLLGTVFFGMASLWWLLARGNWHWSYYASEQASADPSSVPDGPSAADFSFPVPSSSSYPRISESQCRWS